jgi:hypothetical protein
MFDSSNCDYHARSISDREEDRSFANQRFRTWLTVSPNHQIEGYVQMEIGHIL